MARRVICISRTAGADGESIGRAVAEQLGFVYVDEEIIRLASQKAGIDAAEVAKAEERGPLIERVLDALTVDGMMSLAAAYGGGALVPTVAVPPQEEMRTLIRQTIEEVAARGRVVIVAHAASYALRGQPDVLRIFVTASPDVRAQRLTLLDVDVAVKAVRESDKEREHYLRKFYDVRSEESLHYDLVVNTDALAVAPAAAAIVAAAR
jgi:cytidylate kinase